MWGNEPPHSQVDSHFGNWSPDGFLNLQRVIAEVKIQWIKKFLIPLKSFWNFYVRNGIAWPLGYLKQKLWSKERSKVKLPIWLSTTKNRELSWFCCVQMTCHISLESSLQRLQLCFKPHFNRKSAQKSMGLQSRRSPNFKNFETPNLEVPRQNDIWMLAPWPGIENTIKGKVMVSSKSKPWWVLWICVCP